MNKIGGAEICTNLVKLSAPDLYINFGQIFGISGFLRLLIFGRYFSLELTQVQCLLDRNLWTYLCVGIGAFTIV